MEHTKPDSNQLVENSENATPQNELGEKNLNGKEMDQDKSLANQEGSELESSANPKEDNVKKDVVEAKGDASENNVSQEKSNSPPLTELNPVLMEILSNEEQFKQSVKIGSLNELILLIEQFEHIESVNELIPKGRLIKNASEKLQDKGDQDAKLISRFNTVWAKFNRRRSTYIKDQERQKSENSDKKKKLLEQLKAIVEKEDVSVLSAVRAIQDQWKETGWVLQKDFMSLNLQYKHFLDIFYNLRSHFNELRDMDRSYNLEEKRKLIVEIQGIAPTGELKREEWKTRGEQMKNFQELWNTVGHVPKENIEEIEEAFKKSLDAFYEGRKAFFESQDKERKQNGEQKKSILTKLQNFAAFDSKKAKDWNQASKDFYTLQEDWKKIGPAMADDNRDLWRDYRKACDSFFKSKKGFFQQFYNDRKDNLKLKTELCEKAESLMDNPDWKATAEVLKSLQTDWKKIGPVQEKYSTKVWTRFRKACDHFFDRKNEEKLGSKKDQEANLAVKNELILKFKTLAALKTDHDANLAEFKTLQNAWKKSGFVPNAEKEQIKTAYKEATEAFIGMLSLGDAELNQLKLSARMNLIGDEDLRIKRIRADIKKIRYRMEETKRNISSYSVNIEMISKNKSSKSFRDQIQKQIDDETERLESLNKKVRALKAMEKAELEAPQEIAVVEDSAEVNAEVAVTPIEENKNPVEENKTEETASQEAKD